MVEIEIDGQKCEVASGATIIEAADQLGVYIPRFCYHKKLSVAANCRMCLVEVEKAPKPLPACATPVTPGMKVFTQSEKAIKAQRDVMEFLLINHPLDCPICDQGGECELQDLSLGYGRGESCFEEQKRAVLSPDIGPLIETEMTRCIQCTRCVRFGEEIAGERELGLVNRGEKEAISTYVQHVMHSEVSGNIIDLCPVGALTNKPFRYKARAWEMQEHPTVSPHDCVGSNLYLHTRNEIEVPQCKVLRAVPRANEAINETWISDRDRYGVEGLYHEERVYQPLVKRKNKWLVAGWEPILAEIADRLQHLADTDPNKLGIIMSPNCTNEEYFLMQSIARRLGFANIDHRLRQQDFSDDLAALVYPQLGVDIAELENQAAILLIGSNIRHEQPLLALRLVKATNDGGKVFAVNPVDYTFNFLLADRLITPAFEIPAVLAEMAVALSVKMKKPLSPAAKAVAETITVRPVVENFINEWIVEGPKTIILGAEANDHTEAAQVRLWALEIARLSEATLGTLSDGANAAGACLAGVLPHRGPAGASLEKIGLNAKAMFEAQLPAYILFNCEPEFDTAFPALAEAALQNAQCVICINTFMTPVLKKTAHFVLPLAPFSETPGSFVNANGVQQAFRATSVPFGESKPGWKILRVLGNFLELEGFTQENHSVVTEAFQQATNTLFEPAEAFNAYGKIKATPKKIYRLADWPMYSNDALVRRSLPLQAAAHLTEPGLATVAVNSHLAKKLGVQAGDQVAVSQAEQTQMFTLSIDDRLANQSVRLPFGLPETAGFGHTGEIVLGVVS